VRNNNILKRLIDNIKKIDGIEKVTRVYKNWESWLAPKEMFQVSSFRL
jgi:hypothetical protein